MLIAVMVDLKSSEMNFYPDDLICYHRNHQNATKSQNNLIFPQIVIIMIPRVKRSYFSCLHEKI